MRWTKRMQYSPVGIDLGARQLKAVQLARGAAGWQIVAAASAPRRKPETPFDAEEAAYLSDVLYRQGFVGRAVVLSVPQESLKTGIVELPPRASGAPIEQIARMELGRMHNCGGESMELACWDMPASATNRRAGDGACMTAVACTHADADAVLNACESAGWQVEGLDVSACALLRACSPLFADSGQISSVLDVGCAAARLAVVHQGVVVYDRAIADGGLRALEQALTRRVRVEPALVESLLRDLSLSGDATAQQKSARDGDLEGALSAHVEALAQELNAAMSYASHRYPQAPLGPMLLVGGGACIRGMSDRLSQATQLAVRTAAPADVMPCPAPLRAAGGMPSLTAALGLARYNDEE